MGYMCDFCGERRSMVYCRSDAAYLCLSCDRNVHSANALSKRHSRTLVCEKCNSQPAFVRCLDESLSLCQNCDWTLHSSSTSSSSHNKQQINCYSGCPTSSDLSTIWSFIQDIPLSEVDGNSTCEQGLGMLTIEEKNSKDSCGHADKTNNTDFGSSQGDFQIIDGRSVWMGGSSVLGHVSGQCFDQQPSGSENPASPKDQEPKGMDIYGDDPLADLNMDEVDLNFENYDELFGVTLTHSEQLLENGGINSLFRYKEFSATNSNCQGAAGAEGSSAGHSNAIQPACSNAASADSGMSIKTEPIISFAPRQAQSGLSILGPEGESKGGDYHDCGASPSVLLLGEPPWCPPCPENSVTSANRTNAVMRYKEKKKTRKFEKRVRYASRKARADVRKRVKGRFVKAGDAYDYDPLTPTRSF